MLLAVEEARLTNNQTDVFVQQLALLVI